MNEKENLLCYLRHLPCDHIPEHTYISSNSDITESLTVPICERPRVYTGYDVFGVHWTQAARSCHYTLGQKPQYEDIENWRESVRFPNVEKFDWEPFRKAAENVDRENKAVCVTLFVGLMERASTLTSFENCLMDAITSPEDFSDLMGAIADYKIRVINKIAEIAKPDVYHLHDDWGTNLSTFMSPELWRQVIKPHTKRMYDAIHNVGAIVSQHSDGNIASLIPDMIEMGAEAWHGQEECNDMPALEKKYGDKLVFIKNPGGSENKPAMCHGYDRIPEFLYED